MDRKQNKVKNLFLTGERRIGKSTVIDNILAQINTPVSGYRTFFDSYDRDAERKLLISPAGGFGEPVVIGVSPPGQKPLMDMGAFEAAVLRLLRPSADAGLVVIDELGYLEAESELIRMAVFAALGSSVPVLGVLRLGAPGWVSDIGKRPDTRFIVVTEENRELTPDLALRFLNKI